MRAKTLLVSSFLFLVCLTANSQQTTDPATPIIPLKDKIFFGGNFGLQFGTMSIIEASPLIGYKITDKLAVGVGITYIYYRLKMDNSIFSTNVYGGRIFARYYILENIFAHAEYEVLNLERYDMVTNRTNVESLFVGGGYRMKVGERSYFSIMALWNLKDNYYSPYSNPVIRAGFTVGI